MPFILDKTPVLLIIGLSGSVLSTAIPVPAFTEVTPLAGVAQTLSPLKKFKFVGVPVADNAAVKVTFPVAELKLKSTNVVSVIAIPVTPLFVIVTLPVVPLNEIPIPGIADSTPVFVIVIVLPEFKAETPDPLLKLTVPAINPVLSVNTIDELAPKALLVKV